MSLPDEQPRTLRIARWWGRLLLRLAAIAAGAALALQIPLPALEAWLPLRNVLVAVVTVGLMGKALYDTLFYDRFWP